MEKTIPTHYSLGKRIWLEFDLSLALGMPLWLSFLAMSFVTGFLIKAGLGQWSLLLIGIDSFLLVKVIVMIGLFYVWLYALGFAIKTLLLKTHQSFAMYFDATLDNLKTATFLIYVGLLFEVLGGGCLLLFHNQWGSAFWTLFGVWGVIFYVIGFGWSCFAFLPAIWQQEPLTVKTHWLSGGIFVIGLLLMIAVDYLMI